MSNLAKSGHKRWLRIQLMWKLYENVKKTLEYFFKKSGASTHRSGRVMGKSKVSGITAVRGVLPEPQGGLGVPQPDSELSHDLHCKHDKTYQEMTKVQSPLLHLEGFSNLIFSNFFHIFFGSDSIAREKKKERLMF